MQDIINFFYFQRQPSLLLHLKSRPHQKAVSCMFILDRAPSTQTPTICDLVQSKCYVGTFGSISVGTKYVLKLLLSWVSNYVIWVICDSSLIIFVKISTSNFMSTEESTPRSRSSSRGKIQYLKKLAYLLT